MPPPGHKTITLREETVHALDEWRASQRPIPSFTAAATLAIEYFLAAPKAERERFLRSQANQ